MKGDDGLPFPGVIIDGPNWSLGMTDVAERIVGRQPRNEFGVFDAYNVYLTIRSLNI